MNANKKKITVYCASSSKAPDHYSEAAYQLGEILAQNNIVTVFGGGAIGSMGRLADAVVANCGKIIGIMPKFMEELEWAHPHVDEIVWTEDMSQRKQKLLHGTDAVVALPGGSGTFEELFEAITLKRLGIFFKPIIILNQNGFYDALFALFESAIQNDFMDARHRDMWSEVHQVEEILPAIDQAVPWSEDARSFAAIRKEE